MERYWIKQQSTGTFPNPWGGTTTDTISVCNDDSSLVHAYEMSLILRLQITGFTVTTTNFVNAIIPSMAFFPQLTYNVTYYTKSGTETIPYTSQIGRGDAGFAIANIDYSQNSYTNNKVPELLGPLPNAITSQNFEVGIPFKFLFDFATDKGKFLPIKTLQIQYSWSSLLQTFTPPTGAPNFNVQLLGIDYLWPIYRVNDVSLIKSVDMITPPTERIWTLQDFIPVASQGYSKTLGIPGIPSKLYFFMLNKLPATADGLTPGVYDLTGGNPASIINTIQITSGDRTFPNIPIYGSVNTPPTNQTNIIRHYWEQQQLSDNWENDHNSILDFNTWLNTYRIYGVGFSGLSLESQLLVNLNFAAPTATPCYLTFFAFFR